MDQTTEAAVIIGGLVEELKNIIEDDWGCDHSVGICVCGLIDKVDRAESFLRTWIPERTQQRIRERMEHHRIQAVKSLASYKFWMFGYHAGQWVELNKLSAQPEPSPFTALVKAARALREEGYHVEGSEADRGASAECGTQGESPAEEIPG